MSSSPPPLPAEIAGRYQVESRLGAGAFGTVYKAKDKLLGRRVAIKTIRLDGLVATQTALEELVERFQREARVSAQLRHPGIVTIYDVGEADGANYLAMEFIEGSGLDRIIAGERRVAPGRAAAICAQVAEALHYAHEQGVVHRDIKPANIMIEAGDRVKVADFGIAKVKDAGEQQLTATGSLLGTPSYMSPEQARGQQLDGRSDLFSLGCVLYEMLKGRKAFQGDSITALLFKIIAEEPPPLRDDDPEIPDELEAIVRKALAKSPADRYANGQEMADALRAVASAGSLPTLKAAAPGATPATRVLPATAPAASTTLMPRDYNARYGATGNLNVLLAQLHGECVTELLLRLGSLRAKAAAPQAVLIDQFASNPRVLQQALSLPEGCRLVTRTGGEADVACAAASVLARAEFLNGLRTLSTEYGQDLPPGAGSPVIKAGREFKRAFGAPELAKVAKTHFKTLASL